MFHYFLLVPASIKIGCIFILILTMYRMGMQLSFAILLNAVLLGLWSGAGMAGMRYEVAYLLQPESWMLVVVIVLLLFFTESLNVTGRMGKTITALKNGFQNQHLLYGGLPALIGLLPMPGGAVFSAPMVASLDKDNTLDPSLKVAVNYWFRHVWEYWWPLYPGVVLALKYSELSVPMYLAIQMPLSVFSIAGGYWFILRRIPRNPVAAQSATWDRTAAFAALVPIGILVACAAGGSYLLPLAGISGTLANVTAMVIGLLVALIFLFSTKISSLPRALRVFRKRTIWNFAVLVIGVQAFAAALKIPLEGGSQTLVSLMRNEFMGMGVPLVVVMMAIPFVAGAVTGIAMGFVGASFPLVFALLGPNPPLNHVLATTTLAYGFGYLGMTLTPVHVCFAVTNEFFKTRMFSAYRYILPPLAVVTVGILGLSALYYFLF